MVIAVVALASVLVACDSTYALKISNATGQTITVTYTIREQSKTVEEHAYLMAAGQVIDTEDEVDLSGDRGRTLITKHQTVNATATADDVVVYSASYTLEQLKDIDFRIEITTR